MRLDVCCLLPRLANCWMLDDDSIIECCDAGSLRLAEKRSRTEASEVDCLRWSGLSAAFSWCLLDHVGIATTVGGISDVQRPFSVEPKYEFGCVPEMLKHFLVPSFPCRCNLRKDRREKGRCLPCYLIDCLNADRQAEAHHVAAAACVRRRRVRKCALGTSIATLSSPWSRLQHHHHCCLELLRFLIADD